MTRTGGLISTIPVNASLLGTTVSTSFPSKSEVGLSLTPDGTGVTFMTYGVGPNVLDVSNSNTPGHVDITNGVNGQGILIYQRDLVELHADGTSTVTPTNTYSGNNGRNAVLGANGNYFIVGNAGNNGKSITLATATIGITSGSPVVTLSGASTTANIYVGAPFTGNSIPVGAYVTAITDSTHLTLSANATSSTATGTNYKANAGAVQLVGCSFASGATTITVTDTLKLVPGIGSLAPALQPIAYIVSVYGQHALCDQPGHYRSVRSRQLHRDCLELNAER